MRGVPYPQALRAKAVALRHAGYSLNEIRKALRTIPLIPKHTVSGWVSHVTLTPTQLRRIQVMAGERAAHGRAMAVLAWQRKIERWKESIRKQVHNLSPLPFHDPDIGKLACGLLYVCEGRKYPAGRHLSFGNSDPRMILLFLALFRRYFPVDERKFRVTICRRWDQDEQQLRSFWSSVTGIPLTRFYASRADRRTKGQKTKRADYRGVCVVMYFDTTLQYTLQAIGEGVMGQVNQLARYTMSPDTGPNTVCESPPPLYRLEPLLAAAPSVN